MSKSVKDILAPLEPHWDRIIRQPMSAKEIAGLEKQVGLPVPAPLKVYLKTIGLFQDLTYEVSSIEVYESPEDFVLARELLCDILPPDKQDLFPFGDDGAGNVYCVDAAGSIQFVDHETRKVSKKKMFSDWLESVVAKALRGMRRRVPTEHKVWAVQFSFSGTRYEELVKLLASLGRFKAIDAKWSNPVHDDGVKSSERMIELDGERIRIGQLDFGDGKPLLSFDMKEPVAKGLQRSRIRKFNALFKKRCPGYNLVDYGPMDARELEDGE